MCFDLGVDYDNLRGEGKAARVRELVLLFTRKGQLCFLAGTVAIRRPGTILDLKRYAEKASCSAEMLSLNDLANGGAEYRVLVLSLIDRIYERMNQLSDSLERDRRVSDSLERDRREDRQVSRRTRRYISALAIVLAVVATLTVVMIAVHIT